VKFNAEDVAEPVSKGRRGGCAVGSRLIVDFGEELGGETEDGHNARSSYQAATIAAKRSLGILARFA
jgi:hypothetical protein